LTNITDNISILGRQPRTIIGRDQEIESIKKQILREDVHLLTLTGVPGVGKTRLAVAVAIETKQMFAQVVFIDLAPLTTSAQVLPAVARSFGVFEGVTKTLTERLIHSIGSHHSFLILDNCEHLLGAMTEIGPLLNACPELKVLATSREVLRLKWEWVFPVPPLPVPKVEPLTPLKDLIMVPSVALFVQRAQAREPNFKITEFNARLVAEICIRLDGLPLAIELAASQINILGLQELHDRLHNSLNFRTDSPRDAPARHQTLWASIEWSYNLLDSREQALLMRFAVFSGGWTLQAAEKICSGEGLDTGEILDVLEQLVNSSLVQTEDSRQDVAKRYHFLEMIREFALEKLRISGLEVHWRQRHRDWFMCWAEKVEPLTWGPEVKQWMEQLETEFSNLLAGLEWSRNTPGQASEGLRIWKALARFWEMPNHITEGRDTAASLFKLVRERNKTRARALVAASVLARIQGDWESSQTTAEECLDLSREIGDNLSLSFIMHSLATLASVRGDLKQAETLIEESVHISRVNAQEEPQGLYIALFWLGQIRSQQGDFQQAIACLEEGLAISRKLGDRRYTSIILAGLGFCTLFQGDFKCALKILKEGLSISSDIKYFECAAYSLDALGIIACKQNQIGRAARLIGTSQALRIQTGLISWLPNIFYQQYVKQTRAAIGKQILDDAQVFASSLSIEKAIEWALSNDSKYPILLSQREMEIAGLITQGLCNRQIGEKLMISPRTVDAHVRHILDKLQLDSRSQVAAWFTAKQ
jgi:predicted ATPase/DNA-binding CsgD family transcriptional regulator